MDNSERSLLPEGSTLGGRYLVKNQLKLTEMGALYAAEDTRQKRPVTLKVLWPSQVESLGEGVLTRFIREAHISAALPSPHVVPALGGAIDPTTNIPYVVMPSLQGRDLAHWLAEAAPLDPAVAVRIAMQAGKGLRLAHEFGIIHRDIRPETIFLEETAKGICVRVSDFGVAKINPVDEKHITRTGSKLGSPVYVSPEQLVRPRDVDGRADVWSLAMTLYHMLAGKAPLGSVKSFAELVLALSQRDIPFLQDAAPWIEPGLVRVVHGALLRDREARCPSIEAFLEALEPFSEGSEAIYPNDLTPCDHQQRKASRVAPPTRWEPPSGSYIEPVPQSIQRGSLGGSLAGGRFMLGRILHESPSASLYEATDAGEPCVVKVYRREMTEASKNVERFSALLTRVQGLKSEHVARVLAFGVDPDRNLFYVATERLRGLDLGQLIRTRGSLAPGAVARAMVQVCQGLFAAHAAGFPHENIKPSNVFLHEFADGRLAAKLCDFGQPFALEHAEGEDGPAFSVAGQYALSPMYLSPEQVQGKPATFRSDFWSLALVLYEALAGCKPWQGFHSLGELLLAIQEGEMRPIREVAPWVEGGMAEVIHEALRLDPARRYSSVRDIMVALGPFAIDARSLLFTSFAQTRASIVVRGNENTSALEKTALADGPTGSTGQTTSPAIVANTRSASNTRPATPNPSAPPGGSDTIVSGTEPPSQLRSVAIAAVAALLLVGLVAFLALR